MEVVRRAMERLPLIREQLYPAPQSSYSLAALERRYGAERFTVPSINKAISRDVTGLLLPVHEGQTASVCILYSHANGEDLEDAAEIGSRLRKAFMVDVVVFEYTAYGSPELRQGYAPCERALYNDATAAAREMARLRPNARLVCLGRSLGGAMAVHAARELGGRCAALVLLSAFSSAFATKLDGLALRLAQPLDLYRAAAELRAVAPSCAILVLHGDRDAVVPFKLASRLFDAAVTTHKKLIAVQGADHNSTLGEHWPAVERALRAFLCAELHVNGLSCTFSHTY